MRHRASSDTTTRPSCIPCQRTATPATQPAGIDHEPRSRSSVVCAYSATQRTESSRKPERIGNEPDRVAEHLRAGLGHRRQSRIIDRAGETDRQLGFGRVVSGRVDRLGDRDRVDAVAEPGRDDPEQVREAGIHAGAEQGALPAFAGVGELGAIVGQQRVAGDERRRWSRRSRPTRGSAPSRRCSATSGCRRRSRASARATRRCRSWRTTPAAVDSAQLPHVLADLVGRPRVTPDQLQLRGWRARRAPICGRRCRSSTARLEAGALSLAMPLATAQATKAASTRRHCSSSARSTNSSAVCASSGSPGPEVDCRNAVLGEAGDVGPAELGADIERPRLDQVGDERMR